MNLNQLWKEIAIAGIVGTVGLWGTAARAASLGFVDVTGDDAEGTFEKLVPTSPGIYGLEARGGKPGGADWELGIGTQTSNGGTFSQRHFNWDSSSDLFDFSMSWTPGDRVEVTVGDTSFGYNADWQVGNAIVISAKRQSIFNLLSVDGEALTASIGSLVEGENGYTSLYIAGDSLLDGWTIEGEIDIFNNGRSRHEVLITTGTFTPFAPGGEAIPEPLTILGSLVAAGIGTACKLKQRQGSN